MTRTPPRDSNRGDASGAAKPDPLLDRLAALAREERETENRNLDPRWDALAAGTLDDDGVAELRALAETSPEYARAWQAFQPLGDRFQQRVLARIEGDATPQAGDALSAESALPTPGESREEGGNVVAWRPAAKNRERPRPRRHWARTAWIPLAAAAAFAALWLRPEAVVPLPEYEGQLRGVQTERSTHDTPAPAVTRLTPGSRFELVLAPATDVAGSVDIVTWLERGEGLEALELPHEIADSGAVRFSGRIGNEIELPPGPSTLVVAVVSLGDRAASADRGPTPDTVSRWLDSGQHPESDTLRMLRFEIDVDPEPPPPPETDD